MSHYHKYSLFLFFSILLGISCKQVDTKNTANAIVTEAAQFNIDPEALFTPLQNTVPLDYDTSRWSEILVSATVELDLKYATQDNFTEQIIYPCARCFLHPRVASTLMEINEQAQNEKGWHIKLFDCYRPVPAQQKLWAILPNATYVTNPAKGSMHSRGVAVDLTLVDNGGKEIDMGSPFDHFGRISRHDYTGLPSDIQQNRTYLRELMTAYGFNSIKSEWWHYSLSGTASGLSDWEWPCE